MSDFVSILISMGVVIAFQLGIGYFLFMRQRAILRSIDELKKLDSKPKAKSKPKPKKPVEIKTLLPPPPVYDNEKHPF